jgi:hypothetical protein
MMRLLLSLLLLTAAAAQADEISGASERNMEFEFKLGPYRPLVDREFQISPDPTVARPFEQTFGSGPMLFGEVELDRELFQAFGTFSVGASIGYGEKFGKAIDAMTMQVSTESTGIKLVPLKALAVYRWDWAAIKHNIPLVPYLKGGFEMAIWWAVKGNEVNVSDNLPAGPGVRWGVVGVVGLALQIDFLDPRLARDFDTSAGVNHTYLFAEWAVEEVTSFGKPGLDLSSRHAMFGLSFEF